MNPKNAGSNYLKYESQTVWARNAARGSKSRIAEELATNGPEGRRGSKVIVIHPGSRWLRIGRASEVAPVVVPHVIARRHNPPVPPPTFVLCVARPRKGKDKSLPSAKKGDEYSVEHTSDDPVSLKILRSMSDSHSNVRSTKRSLQYLFPYENACGSTN